jgi:hypothetical protein
MFKPGTLVQLNKDINAIPSGKYYFTGEENGFLYFSVENSASIGITSDVMPFLSEAPDGQPTPFKNFVRRYYKLMEKSHFSPSNDSSPFTMCFMTPTPLPVNTSDRKYDA